MLQLYRVLIVLLLFSACTQDKIEVYSELDKALERQINRVSETGSLDHFILPEDGDYASIPQDPSNPLTAEKIALGKMLFFETGLGLAPAQDLSESTYSCATCHIPSAGFRPGAAQGVADGGFGYGLNGEERKKHPLYPATTIDAQGIRPLSVLNVAYVTNTLWNGQFGSNDVNEGLEALWEDNPDLEVNKLGFSGLESQNIEGLHLHRMVVNKEVLDSYGYTPYFDNVFPEFSDEERYGTKAASFAISAYLRSLITNKAPFQDWLKGNKQAMNNSEKNGALVFFNKGKCATCHRGKSFSAMNFYALGVKDLYEAGGLNTSADDKKNLGRGGFTKQEEDLYKFKVPQLYNLRNAPHYFHGSSKYSLPEVIDYFDAGIPENPNVPVEQIAPNFTQLNLTENEKKDLLAFLENALYDPEIDRYVPERVLSNNCLPNNDPFSKLYLGCD